MTVVFICLQAFLELNLLSLYSYAYKGLQTTIPDMLGTENGKKCKSYNLTPNFLIT